MELINSNGNNSKNRNSNNTQPVKSETSDAPRSVVMQRLAADEEDVQEVVPASIVVGLLLEQVGKL